MDWGFERGSDTRNIHQTDKEELIPPSCFELPPVKHGTRLKRNEPVISLPTSRYNVQTSMSQPIPPDTSYQSFTAVPSIPSITGDVGAYDSIVRRQSVEIDRLRQQLQQMEVSQERRVLQLEGEIATKESGYKEKVNKLTSELDAVKKNLTDEIERGNTERSRLTSECSTRVADWQTKYEALKSEHDVLMKKCEENETRSKNTQQLSDCQQRLRECELLLEERQRKITQMTTYISESDSTTRSADVWRQEKTELQNKLEVSEKVRLAAEKNLEFVNCRLTSLEKILSIQEQQLSKFSKEDLMNRKNCLLTRWREKVYELLVQLKCAELTAKDEDRRFQSQLYKLQQSSDEQKNDIELLQHTLTDKQAVIDMQRQELESLTNRLNLSEQQLQHYVDVRQNDTTSVQLVHQTISTMIEKFSSFDSVIVKANTTLKSYGKRVAYASGRVELLQGQFARREALLKAELFQLQDVGNRKDEQAHLMEMEELKEELERVEEEKNHLAAMVKQDAETLQQKIASAAHDAIAEANRLREELRELRDSMEEKCQITQQLQAALDDALVNASSTQEEMEMLKNELARATQQIQEAAETAATEVHQQNRQQLVELEKSVNEARREHAKTVVQLRQYERQMDREKEKQSEELRRLMEEHQEELDRLTNKLQTLQRENNMMIVTLRQEGLLSKVKQQTKPTFDPTLTNQQSIAGTGSLLTSGIDRLAAGDNSLINVTDEPLHSVIDDIRQLTSEVLADDDDDDDDVTAGDINTMAPTT